MSQDAAKPSLNLTRIAVAMTAVAALLLAIVCFVLPMVLKGTSSAHAALAGGLTYVCMMTGLLLMYIAKDAGPLILLKAHMLAMGMRMMLTLGIGYALVAITGMELYSIVITMSAIYLPLMAVETAMSVAEFQRCFASGPQTTTPDAREALS